MASLSERLAAARANAVRFPSDPRAYVGREAEYDVAFGLRARLRGTGWRVHHGLRIPGPRGRREVDFVITTPEVGVVVELKNWAGAIELEGGRLVQHRRPPKAPVDHGPVFADLAHKLDLLAAFHAERGRPAAELQPLVVFYDHRLQMPAALRARDDVTTYAQLTDELPGRDAQPPSPGIAALRESLDEIGGWDVVALHGGRTVFGDVRHTPVGDRALHASVEVRADRGVLGALLRPPRVRSFVVGRDGARTEVPCDPDAEIVFRPAGRSKVQRVAWRHVLSVEFG